MTPADVRRMAAMVRAIKAGRWTHELPAWANRQTTPDAFNVLHEMPEDGQDEYRAVQTAEAFILLCVNSRFPLNVEGFLTQCGFRP